MKSDVADVNKRKKMERPETQDKLTCVHVIPYTCFDCMYLFIYLYIYFLKTTSDLAKKKN